MPDVRLSTGTIEYEDTGGSGPIVVFLHGLAMNGSPCGATSSRTCEATTAVWFRPCRSAAIVSGCAATPSFRCAVR
jgi:hypothetical protein